MSLINQGISLNYTSPAAGRPLNSWRRFARNLIFPVFLIFFYIIVLFYIGPVDGINDDWGIYSILSGAYLGKPEAHVLFFLYPLSFLLSSLYLLNSSIPWFSLFLHIVHISCIYIVYHRIMQLRKKHGKENYYLLPAISILIAMFFLADINMICETQYTTTAGFAAATSIFCFITAKSDNAIGVFLWSNLPTFFLSWLAFCIRQNVFYMMLPMAGMLFLAKWLLTNHRFYKEHLIKMFSFAGILILGAGILYGIHLSAYSDDEWADYMKINYYRERIGDFYTWPEYEECAEQLSAAGIDEITYYYMKSGAPYIGYGMSLSEWEDIHRITKKCYHERTEINTKIQQILTGSVAAFLNGNGMRPFNLCVGMLLLCIPIIILYQRNYTALAAYFFYLTGRAVTWIYVLYEGRFPKRIMQPLLSADFMILLGILLAFGLFRPAGKRHYAILLSCLLILSVFSVYGTKQDVDTAYRSTLNTWEDLKNYCFDHPENFYIWTYGTNTLETYCEQPFASGQDTYQNFFYTNWGVVLSPNSKVKLAKHGIQDFGKDLGKQDNIYFIFAEGTYHAEHPVTMYFRVTLDMDCVAADTFRAGDMNYEIYQLIPKESN